MPDSSGRFRGISVPELPWHRPHPVTHRCTMRCFDEPRTCPWPNRDKPPTDQ